jgi:CRISPR-associated protein Cas2
MTRKAEGAPQAKGAPLPQNRRQWLVVSYDIPDDRRRTKLMKTLEGYGSRVQYSVFECDLRPADLEELQARVRQLIRREEDDVRFYPLCDSCVRKVLMLGKARAHRHVDYIVDGSR